VAEPDDNDANEEKAHYQQLRQIKLRNLRILEEQIEEYGGKKHAPPHILASRDDLRKSLGIVETVLAFPLDISDELDERGRFAAYIGGLKEIRQLVQESVSRMEQSTLHAITGVEERMGRRQDTADKKARWWRIGGTIAFFVLIIVVLAIAGFILFWAGRFTGGQTFMRDMLALWR
jgi:hypothetical protein